MFDERIVVLAKQTIASQLRDMEEPLAMKVSGWMAKLRGNGRLFIYVSQAYKDEIKVRSQVIWRNLQRAHSSFGAPRSVTLRQDLLNIFRSEINEVVTALTPKLDKDMGGCPQGFDYKKGISDTSDNEISRHEAEIEHYVVSLESAAVQGVQVAGSYNFYGSIGAVMTAPGAIANVIQNIGADEKNELIEALNLVRIALNTASELHTTDKRELVEIVDGAVEEIQRDHPNTRRLSQALQNITAAVQGISSGTAAYEAIRSAANAIGIPL